MDGTDHSDLPFHRRGGSTPGTWLVSDIREFFAIVK
jgi:hypothetical protein